MNSLMRVGGSTSKKKKLKLYIKHLTLTIMSILEDDDNEIKCVFLILNNVENWYNPKIIMFILALG